MCRWVAVSADCACWRTFKTSNGVTANDVIIAPTLPAIMRPVSGLVVVCCCCGLTIVVVAVVVVSSSCWVGAVMFCCCGHLCVHYTKGCKNRPLLLYMRVLRMGVFLG